MEKNSVKQRTNRLGGTHLEETAEQRSNRLEKRRQQYQRRKASETPEKRALRLENQRLRRQKQKASQTPEQQALRLENQRLRNKKQKQCETPVQRASRLENKRLRKQKQKESETPEQRGSRLKNQRLQNQKQKTSETPEKRASRLENQRLQNQKLKASETPEKRASRLESQRLRKQKQKVSEPPEKRATRLEMQRLRKQKHRLAETNNEQIRRRVKDCEHKARMRAQETQRKRAVRLKKMRQINRNRRREVPTQYSKNDCSEQTQINQRRLIQPMSPFCARNSPTNVQEYNVGNMDVACPHCMARHFAGERNSRKSFSTCCNSGKVFLRPLNNYPERMLFWLTGENDKAKHFRKFIRQYNNAFAFASFRYTPVVHRGSGPQTFVIHGQAYHQTANYGTVREQENPAYSQLYFLDPDFANEARLNNSNNSGCRSDMMIEIDNLIQQINPYANAYRMMKNVVETTPTATVEMWIVKNNKYDQRRYNLPVEKNQVAAVFTSGAGNEEDFQREICVHPIGDTNTLSIIAITNPNCDPMTYPMLFPYGDAGYDYRINNLSMLQFYAYRLQCRPTFNPLLHASKLTQQYIVDAYLKVEAERLNWIRHDQAKLRIESYQGLMDFANHQAQQKNLKPGKMFILPSSFTGGKRAMQESYQDCMAMVAAKGKLDLFVTFTCNPKWKEITSSILPHETAVDRPDIVAKVFQLKLAELLEDITVRNVFGKVLAWQYVIEFQKRGLPHCHMLIILDETCKIKEPNDIDTVVCAEIPDKEEDPILHEIVCNSMLHGPCGVINPKCPCTEKDKYNKYYCTKGFPKEFSEETVLSSNGYPQYRRRNDGRIHETKSGQRLDNRWVVPYNKFLCKKYNAHINVEICTTIKSVKYIYKYVYKGHDAAIVQVKVLGDETGYYHWDEIQAYIDTRYISAPEAIWRLLKYLMQKRSHAIIRLAVHLPFGQNVVFRSDDTENDRRTLQAALQKAERKLTTLLAWFKLNQVDSNARQYLYREIPMHYVQDPESGHYHPRQRRGDSIVPRMYAVSPREMERYSLRLLLLHVRGATCFEDLQTVDGQLFDTFKEAALARKLIEEDRNWYATMEEAVAYQMPTQLRMLFGAICEFGYPANPKDLFGAFKSHMMEDYMKKFVDEELALNMCLTDLEEYFVQFGHSCVYYGLPEPQNVCDVSDLTDDVTAERDEAERLANQLNAEQRHAYNQILNAVEGHSPHKCFFLSGAGGCGKTFLYAALITTLLGRRKRVKAVAPTGLAATLLRNGQTVHFGFGLPLNIDSKSVSRIRQGSKEWKMLKETELIIWDEISMCTKHMFNAVNRSLQDLLSNTEPFGGIPIVVGGDFRQQAPVLKHASRTTVDEMSVKRSELWCKFRKIELTQNMRVNQDEIEFTNWLLNIGNGKDADEKRSHHVQMPTEVLCDDILTAVLGEEVSYLSKDELALRPVLCPLNEDTLKINERVLTMLPGDMKSYYSIDTVADCETEEERDQYSVEVLNSFTPMGMPPHQLNLKVGCCVMLLRNLNPKRGLCNGTRLIIERMDPNILHCSIFSGDRRGESVMMPRLILDTSDSDTPFQLRRKQFPLRLAYSMTITKSQGQTFEKIGLYLPKPVFAHGQLYTALSRVKSMKGLFVEVENGSNQGKIYEDDENTYTYNCVYDDLLK